MGIDGLAAVNELRLDPLSGRWVAISAARADRPSAFALSATSFEETRRCPFCPGHEEASPPALETYGPTGNWLVRVVPNLYPAFEGDQPFVVENRGPVFTQATAGGIHEILILSPEHQTTWAELSDDQASLVMAALRDRIEEHSQQSYLRYSQAIVNSGREAGASIEHPHGQLLGMSFVPRELVDELAGFSRFSGSCLLCTTLHAESDVGHRIVEITEEAVVLCPFWSGVPFEMMVVPRRHGAHLHRSSTSELEAVGRAMRYALGLLRERLGDIAYNLVFHSAPYRVSGTYHWHVHILPKMTTLAGFELGTGVLINIVAPEQAAPELRAIIPAEQVEP